MKKAITHHHQHYRHHHHRHRQFTKDWWSDYLNGADGADDDKVLSVNLFAFFNLWACVSALVLLSLHLLFQPASSVTNTREKVILLLNPISLFGRPNFQRLLFLLLLFLVNQHQPTTAASTLLPLTNSNKKYLKAASVFTCLFLSLSIFENSLSTAVQPTTTTCCKDWRHNFTSMFCVIISFFFASSQTRIIILCALGLSLCVCVSFVVWPLLLVALVSSLPVCCLFVPSVCLLTSKKAVLLP